MPAVLVVCARGIDGGRVADDQTVDLRTSILAALARAAQPVCPTAILPLQQSSSGGSGAFLVRADDEKRYWCKCLGNPQGPRVPANEQIVGRLGRIIGAAVCDVSIIRIPAELKDWEYRPGQRLAEGYAHGSLAIAGPFETRSIQHAGDDANPERLTSLRILADWCWGGDHQWLYVPAEENRYFSHDHGHYFPGGPNWTIDTLRSNDPSQAAPGAGTIPAQRPEVALRIAEVLAQMDELGIARALAGLPSDWPVKEDELVEMTTYLARRRLGVIERIQLAHGKGRN